jgi:hypothetical protein
MQVESHAEITTVINLREPLRESVLNYLDGHPDWDQDRLINAAVSLFLMQNSADRRAAKTYLNTILGDAA